MLADIRLAFTDRAFRDHAAEFRVARYASHPRSTHHNALCERFEGRGLREFGPGVPCQRLELSDFEDSAGSLHRPQHSPT